MSSDDDQVSDAGLEDMLAVLNAGPPPAGYVRFDERADVIAALDLVALVAPKCREQPSYWKWLIIAAHNALQGALVCCLSGSAGIGALTEKSQRAVLARMEAKCGAWPTERLAGFKQLVDWGCDTDRMQGHPLTLTHEQRTDLRHLNDELRNQFSHFKPEHWSIEAAGLPRIVLTAIDAAEHLMLNHPAARLHLAVGQEKQIRRNVDDVRAALRKRCDVAPEN
jgi:hypothetical protein